MKNYIRYGEVYRDLERRKRKEAAKDGIRQVGAFCAGIMVGIMIGIGIYMIH